ncbi:MAG: 3-phosphoshikimate 1-carboxyvinyltransferase [Raineya sp.]|nr:3-phosphoshikimate 1-carboxyvinyltransferase [Raineya sp.]
MQLFISNKKIEKIIELPASKSESNRALLIEALAQFQGARFQKTQLSNISEARDTQTLQRLLSSQDKTLDVLDAGTTMRFLTAFCSVTNRETILTGTPRMKERPIHILVEALKELGADIDYLEQKGFPPIYIKGFQQYKKEIEVESNISSQYISALLMVAPVLEQGLEINLKNSVASKPYIEMTLSLMGYFGIEYVWENNKICIEPQKYNLQPYTIESDWSAASYWYSVAAITEEASILLPHLKENSLQGDKAIVEIMKNFGVETTFLPEGVHITKTKNTVSNNHTYDFTHCPDLAQTIVALCVAKNIELTAKGVESLKIKETNRLLALQNEVAKFGFDFQEQTNGDWLLKKNRDLESLHTITINTYEDHRMAMAFAPLAMLYSLVIEQPEVVHKSYPHFWREMQKLS